MTEKRFKYLYQGYLNKTQTETEFLEWCEIIAGGLYEKELEVLADNLWDEQEIDMHLSEDKSDKIFSAILANTDQLNEPKSNLIWRNSYQMAVAAAVFIFLSLGILFFNNKLRQGTKVLQAKAVLDHKLIRLADGSTVVLNHNSYLKYPKTFNGSDREVTLVGEAYFDIKHDEHHPFMVHTGNLLTTVLGTAFNIKAYDLEKNITITVTRGKVSVSNENKLLGVITPDQQLSFNKVESSVVQTAVNSIQTVEWQSKDLFFEDMTMQQAATELEQRFNVKIAFTNDAIKKCRFTGTFLHGEKLKDILQVICEFNNATFKTSADGSILINGPGCSS